MAGNATADIIFCLDASGSMGPCIEAVRDNITRFAEVFRQDANSRWDVRLDFLLHHAEDGITARSVHEGDVLPALYGRGQGMFFTTDVKEFQRGLDSVAVGGDEVSLVALDCAMDFPWRPDATCRRVVVLITDEAVETGAKVHESIRVVPDLVEKLMALKVMLYLITPDSAGFEAVAQADRADWIVIQDHSELESADLGKLLVGVAKSISVSQTPLGAPSKSPRRALFGQDSWR